MTIGEGWTAVHVHADDEQVASTKTGMSVVVLLGKATLSIYFFKVIINYSA